MIILFQLYPSHLLIAIEWSGIWLHTVALSECFCQYSLHFGQNQFVFPYHSAKAGVYHFLPLRNLLIYFFVSIVPQ